MILVVLVLTVVGLGIAYFTSTEDRMSGNTKMSRIGFYAAEAGLRDAEAAVTSYAQLNLGNATPLLALPHGRRCETLVRWATSIPRPAGATPPTS